MGWKVVIILLDSLFFCQRNFPIFKAARSLIIFYFLIFIFKRVIAILLMLGKFWQSLDSHHAVVR